MVVDKEQKDVEGWRCCCGFSKSKESSRADETVGEDVVVRGGISGPCAEWSIWGCEPFPRSTTTNGNIWVLAEGLPF